MEAPHHVLLDAPVATTWWFVKAQERIESARPDELDGIAKELVPHAWGALRKVRGGAAAKRRWLSWTLAMLRVMAIRATDTSWDNESSYGVEDPDPIHLYCPLVAAAQAAAPQATPAQLAAAIRQQVGGRDWEDADRATALVAEALAQEAVKQGAVLPD